MANTGRIWDNKGMEKEMLNLLSQFVSFETIEGNLNAKTECLDWVQTAFLGCSHSPVRSACGDAPYLYLPCEDAKLLWFAHIDVVPASKEMFTVTVEGGRALGRGVKDMKGAALPFLMAYRDSVKQGSSPAVSILITSDEETAGDTIPTLLSEGELNAPVAFTPDTGMYPHIVVEHKGVIWATLEAHGKGAHAAAPWEGKNPVQLLAKAIAILDEEFQTGTNDDWQMTVTPTKLKGSEARNQIPENATCSVDIRHVSEDGASTDEILGRIQKVLPHDCTIHEVLSADPLHTNPDHEMVQRLKRIAEDITGTSIPIGREHGATDARYFSAAGIPAFLYGPEGGGLHAPDEWVSVSSLLDQYEISRRLLSELAQ